MPELVRRRGSGGHEQENPAARKQDGKAGTSVRPHSTAQLCLDMHDTQQKRISGNLVQNCPFQLVRGSAKLDPIRISSSGVGNFRSGISTG